MERYEAYKDSGIEWIGTIPETWAVQRFRWTLKRVNRQPLESDEIVTCFRDGEVTLRKNRREDGFTMSDKEIGYQHICAGDFVIHGMDGFAGAMGISDSDGKASPVLMAFRPVGRQDLRYINYLLRLYAWRNVFLALSTTIRVRSCDLNWAKVAPLPLTLPGFKEQQAIADYLDAKTAEIDALVADCEREVDLLQEYRKAVISEAVTKSLDPNVPMKDSGIEWIGEIPEDWRCCRVKQVAYVSSGATPNRENYSYWNGSIPWIKTGELQNALIYESEECITKTALDETSVQLYPAGTILMAMYGQGKTRGMTGMLAMASTTNQACAAIQVYTADESSFIWKALIAGYDAIRDVALGSGQPNLNAELVSNFHIPLPNTVEEQRRIVADLDVKTAEIDSLVETKQNMADRLREYRRSLISEAVTGKFKVPDVE